MLVPEVSSCSSEVSSPLAAQAYRESEASLPVLQDEFYPAPTPAERAEPEPWSQMTQFDMDNSPVRSRPGEETEDRSEMDEEASVSPERERKDGERFVSQVKKMSQKESSVSAEKTRLGTETEQSPVKTVRTRSRKGTHLVSAEQKRPEKEDTDDSVSQSSSGSFATCNETLSEHNYSRGHIDLDDLLETYTDLDEEEDNVPVDSMDVNVDKNETLTNDNVGKNDTKTDVRVEMENRTSANESQDMFESDDSGKVEIEISKENSNSKICVEEKSAPQSPPQVSPSAQVSPEEGINTVSRYRSNLVVSCEPDSSHLDRKNCHALLTAEPGEPLSFCLEASKIPMSELVEIF